MIFLHQQADYRSCHITIDGVTVEELKQYRNKDRPTSKVYTLGGRRRKLIVGGQNSLYEADDGSILDYEVSPELVEISGVSAWAFKKQRLPVAIATDGRRRVYPTRKLDTFIHFGGVIPLNSGAVYEYTLNGSTVSTQRPRFRIDYVSSDRGLKFIIDCNSDAPTRWEMPISFQGCELVGRNLVVNGNVVARVPLIKYWDEDKPLEVKTASHLMQDNRLLFEVAPTSGKRFIIDPQVVTGLSAGSYIQNGEYLNNNYSAVDFLMVYYHSLDNATIKSVTRVDLSAVPAGSVFTSASASLYCWYNTDATGHNASIYRIIYPGFVPDEVTWASIYSGVFWNTGGLGAGTDYTTTNTADASLLGIGNRDVWDITTQANDAFSAGTTYDMLVAFNPLNPSGALPQYGWHSQIYSDTAKRPIFTFDYDEPVAASGFPQRKYYYY